MKFKHYINEVFNTPVKYTVDKDVDIDGSFDWDGEFTVDGNQYNFNILKWKEKIYMINFSLTTKGKGFSQNVENLGTSILLKVFSTIIKIIKDFMEEGGDKVDGIIFSAESPSRRKLYDKMVNVLSKKYKLKVKRTETKEHVKYKLLK